MSFVLRDEAASRSSLVNVVIMQKFVTVVCFVLCFISYWIADVEAQVTVTITETRTTTQTAIISSNVKIILKTQ